MSKLGALVRAGLKSNFGMAVLYHRLFREKKDRWLVPMIALSLLGISPMLYGLVVFIKEMYFILKPIGQEHAILALGILAGQLVILIFGIYYILSAFYFSRDLDMLVPLPVRPSEVLISKFVVLMVNEYLTVAIIVLPFIVAFGVLDGGGFGYWVSAALVYLALPVIPLVVVSLIVVPMMRFINVSRKKDILILVGSVAVLTAAFGFQFLAQKAQRGNVDTQQMVAFLTSPDSLLHRLGSNFPPSIWATKAVAGGFSAEGFANLAVFLATSLILFAAMIILAEKLFYRGVIGLNETSGRRRLLSRDEMSHRVSSGRRAVYAIFMREFRIMNRTPVFLLNGVLIVMLLPAFFILTTRTGSHPPQAELQKLIASGHSLYPILILAMFMIVCCCLNGTASSTFSREGVQFWISRVIPVSPMEQVAAKFLHSYLIATLGIVAALVAVVFFIPVSPIHIVFSAGLALITAALLTAVGMMIDLARPLLDWTNPQKAIKQNLNVLLGMFADAGILAVAFFGIRALVKAGVGGNTILGVLFAALMLLSYLSWFALCRFADKRYREIE
jgi:ABC-2 type transport system permease protein